MPHILIAHTGIATRTLLQIGFERKQYPMDLTSSPAEALTAASRHPPDLAIINIAFGSVSGFDLAADLRAMSPK